MKVYSDEELFLTMLRPIDVSHVEEVERLILRTQTDDLQFPIVWTTALTPYTRTGYVGLGILSRMMNYAKELLFTTNSLRWPLNTPKRRSASLITLLLRPFP